MSNHPITFSAVLFLTPVYTAELPSDLSREDVALIFLSESQPASHFSVAWRGEQQVNGCPPGWVAVSCRQCSTDPMTAWGSGHCCCRLPWENKGREEESLRERHLAEWTSSTRVLLLPQESGPEPVLAPLPSHSQIFLQKSTAMRKTPLFLKNRLTV